MLSALYLPPHAGLLQKTTLLNALADRLTLGKDAVLSGMVAFNDSPMTPAMKKEFGYVTQTDIVYETATPRECTTFSAILRLQGVSHEDKLARAETVIKRLRLTKAADTIIGTEGLRRGISGGERKRTNVAIELVTSPGAIGEAIEFHVLFCRTSPPPPPGTPLSAFLANFLCHMPSRHPPSATALLFLDEPTSGLDSFTALEVLKCLKDLAVEGRGVVCTIHQPSSELVRDLSSRCTPTLKLFPREMD